MIEFCSKKRMVAVIILLIGFGVEMEHSSCVYDGHRNDADNASKLCTESGGHIETVEKCIACTEFQMKSLLECKFTSYVEKVSCKMSDGKGLGIDFIRSCRRSAGVEEQRFWLFEFVVAVVGAVSYSVVHIRQKRLDRLLMEKVHRQIASGV